MSPILSPGCYVVAMAATHEPRILSDYSYFTCISD